MRLIEMQSNVNVILQAHTEEQFLHFHNNE